MSAAVLVGGCLAVLALVAVVAWRRVGGARDQRVANSAVHAPPQSVESNADLCLSNAAGDAVVEFRVFAGDPQRLLPVPDELLKRLAPLQQALPQILTALPLTDGRTVRVSVHVSKLVRGNDGNLIGAIRDAAGRWKRPPGLRPISLSTLVGPAGLQALSIVVAQQHLADISEKLSDISEGVKRIEQFQRLEQRARIRTGIEHILKQILPAAAQGAWDQDMVSRLGDFETTFAAIGEHMNGELGEAAGKLKSMKMSGSSSDNIFRAYEEEVARLRQAADCAVLCLKGRALGARVLALKPLGSGTVPANRLAHIAEDASTLGQQLSGSDCVWEVARNCLGTARADLPARPFIRKSLRERKAKAIEDIETQLLRFTDATEQIRFALDRARHFAEAIEQPIELAAVRGPDGQVAIKLLAAETA